MRSNDIKYCVYMHTNKESGKKYIGITSLSPKRRWSEGKGYRHQMFGKAIEKYGWDGFYHCVLYENLSFEEACDKEKTLIKEYKSNIPKYGYNIESGGNDARKNIFNTKLSIPVHMYGLDGKYIKTFPSVMEAQRQTGISNSNIAACCKGRHGYTNGYQWSYEKVDSMPKIDKDEYRLNKITKLQYKTVYQYTLDDQLINIYPSLTKASEETGIGFKMISRCCRGERPYTHGFKWSYERYA